MLGDEKDFAEFVAARGDGGYRPPSGKRLDEPEARDAAARVLGDIVPVEVKTLPVGRRNQLLRDLRAAGLSVRQVERLTGVGRNIVARA